MYIVCSACCYCQCFGSAPFWCGSSFKLLHYCIVRDLTRVKQKSKVPSSQILNLFFICKIFRWIISSSNLVIYLSQNFQFVLFVTNILLQQLAEQSVGSSLKTGSLLSKQWQINNWQWYKWQVLLFLPQISRNTFFKFKTAQGNSLI